MPGVLLSGKLLLQLVQDGQDPSNCAISSHHQHPQTCQRKALHKRKEKLASTLAPTFTASIAAASHCIFSISQAFLKSRSQCIGPSARQCGLAGVCTIGAIPGMSAKRRRAASGSSFGSSTTCRRPRSSILGCRFSELLAMRAKADGEVFIALVPTVTSRMSTSCPIEKGHFMSALRPQCPVQQGITCSCLHQIWCASRNWLSKFHLQTPRQNASSQHVCGSPPPAEPVSLELGCTGLLTACILCFFRSFPLRSAMAQKATSGGLRRRTCRGLRRRRNLRRMRAPTWAPLLVFRNTSSGLQPLGSFSLSILYCAHDVTAGPLHQPGLLIYIPREPSAFSLSYSTCPRQPSQ